MRLNQKTKAVKLEPAHLTFLAIRKDELAGWEKKQNTKSWTTFRPADITFISVHDLKKRAREITEKILPVWGPALVYNVMPGLASNHWVNNYSPKEKSYRFATIGGEYTDKALLIDDVFEWCHHRREAKDVRSAWDIILAIKRGELEL